MRISLSLYASSETPIHVTGARATQEFSMQTKLITSSNKVESSNSVAKLVIWLLSPSSLFRKRHLLTLEAHFQVLPMNKNSYFSGVAVL
ncbi:hypothetical protein Csa_008172 [Cucumis sativus]|nr:hypothetical protein Csa_008172 [Cucumis sativus]